VNYIYLSDGTFFYYFDFDILIIHPGKIWQYRSYFFKRAENRITDILQMLEGDIEMVEAN
jgi:hypothetical protein